MVSVFVYLSTLRFGSVIWKTNSSKTWSLGTRSMGRHRNQKRSYHETPILVCWVDCAPQRPPVHCAADSRLGSTVGVSARDGTGRKHVGRVGKPTHTGVLGPRPKVHNKDQSPNLGRVLPDPPVPSPSTGRHRVAVTEVSDKSRPCVSRQRVDLCPVGSLPVERSCPLWGRVTS